MAEGPQLQAQEAGHVQAAQRFGPHVAVQLEPSAQEMLQDTPQLPRPPGFGGGVKGSNSFVPLLGSPHSLSRVGRGPCPETIAVAVSIFVNSYRASRASKSAPGASLPVAGP
jgi:hypothetical protein